MSVLTSSDTTTESSIVLEDDDVTNHSCSQGSLRPNLSFATITTESSIVIEDDDGADQPCLGNVQVQGPNRLKTDFPDLSIVVVCPYLIQVWIGLGFLTADIGTDIFSAIYNINTGITLGMHGRIIQGVLSLLIVIFPCFQYLTSNNYKRQENMVPARGNLSKLYGKTGLKIKIFDTLIWQYNHARHTNNYMVCRRKYDDKNMNALESARRDFYISKQMAQLGVKIEAQLEASYQIGLAALVYFHYYDEYSLGDKIIMVVSLVFSVISIARAATSDLMKNGVKSKKSIGQVDKFRDYPEQNAIWKICRFLSVFCQIVATLVNVPCNYWISLWWLGDDFTLFELRTFGIIVAVSLMNLSFNTVFQLTWATLNDFKFLCRDANEKKRSKCQIVQRWFHFFVRSPFINAFRSPSLYNYSLSYCRVLCLLTLNSVSLLILSLPNIYFGTHRPIYAVLNYVFIGSILLNMAFSVIVKFCTNPIPEDMLPALAKASRLP